MASRTGSAVTRKLLLFMASNVGNQRALRARDGFDVHELARALFPTWQSWTPSDPIVESMNRASSVRLQGGSDGRQASRRSRISLPHSNPTTARRSDYRPHCPLARPAPRCLRAAVSHGELSGGG